MGLKFFYTSALALCLLGMMLSLSTASMAKEPAMQIDSQFTNPVYEGADPWIVKKDGWYYLCRSEWGHTLSVWKSKRLTDRGERKEVWKPPKKGWNTHNVWAPELHFIDGHWYIYYAADTGSNANHRMGVLQAETDDPQGAYRDLGMLYTGDDIEGRTNNRWAIDGTVMKLNEQLYFIWSGWPAGQDVQYLYIAKMENPWTVSSSRVKLCNNADYVWERVSEDPAQRGLHEGSQVLQHQGRVFLIYSCSGSWEKSYKLGMLILKVGSDPMQPENWTKQSEPVFQPTAEVPGVGHCSFVKSPDDSEDWIVYHAKNSPEPSWARSVWMQRFTWSSSGLPQFGTPQKGPMAKPTGECVKR